MIQLEHPAIRRGFAFFKHLDLQRRLIAHESMDSNEAGSLRVRNIKRGLQACAGQT